MHYFRLLYTKASGLNLAHLLVLGLIVKALVSDVSYPTFLLSIPVLAFEGYKLYLKARTPDPIKINEELVKEIDNIKSKLNAQSMEKNIKAPVARYF